MWAPRAQWGRVLRFDGPKMHHENMPQGQVNAYLADGLQMRVGVPHRGGKLAFHAFNEGFSAMVSASAFWNPARSVFVIPEASDLYEIDWALDSAGFTAVKGWQAKGTQPGMAGIYPWSLAAYVEAASLLRPSWWSAPDLCNEMQVAANPDEVRHRSYSAHLWVDQGRPFWGQHVSLIQGNEFCRDFTSIESLAESIVERLKKAIEARKPISNESMVNDAESEALA